MYTGNTDIMSWLIYILLGLYGMLIIRGALRAKEGLLLPENTPERIMSNRALSYLKLDKIILRLRIHRIDRRFLYMAAFVVLFTFFAAFRKVAVCIGGADAVNYSKFFYYSNLDVSSYSHLIREPLFVYVCKLLRVFTSNYRVFFALSYGFVAASYCIFINKFCDKKGSFAPFVMLMFLYLKAFCTLRTSLAVALILIGLTYIDKNRKVSLVWIASSVLVHRASILFVLVFFFYAFCHKIVNNLKGKKLAVAVTAVNLVFIALARLAQAFISWTNAFGLLSQTDLYYVLQTRKTPLIAKFPMYLVQTLLFLAIVFFEKQIKPTKEFKALKTVCVFDFITAPLMLILGIWRANEYFFLPRLAMWSIMIPQLEPVFVKLTKGKIKVIWYRAAVFVAFFAWFVFRIYSEWDDLKIMPYIISFYD